jgi:ABC-type transporter Mla MlaB component
VLLTAKGVTNVLRITHHNGLNTTTLNVEGKLTRRTITSLASACLPLLDSPRDLVLDFTHVVFIDEPAAVVVRDLIRREVAVRGCSPLVSNLLKESAQ